MSWTQIGALSGAAAVALGAFGAHGLKNYVQEPKLLETWNTAAQYHLVHSVLLTVAPLLSPSGAGPLWSARLLSSGLLLFSGSLYALVLTNQRKLGAVTPVGGLALIGGWLALAARR